jgi:hypothetical protein
MRGLAQVADAMSEVRLRSLFSRAWREYSFGADEGGLSGLAGGPEMITNGKRRSRHLGVTSPSRQLCSFISTDSRFSST